MPPLLIGGRGPKTLALAGELADGLCLDAGLSAAGVAQAIASRLRGGRRCAAAQRSWSTCRRAARRAAPSGSWASCAPPAGPLPERAALGPPAEVAAAIRAFAEAGATTVALQPAGDDPDVAGTVALAAAARERLRTEHLRTEHLRTGD